MNYSYQIIALVIGLPLVFWLIGRHLKKKIIAKANLQSQFKKLKGTEKEIKEQEVQLLTPYIFKENIKGLSWWNIKQRWILKHSANSVMMINMELNNGDFVQFIVNNKQGFFKYKGGVYTFDEPLKYYNISTKLWCQDYHEGIPCPVLRKVPTVDIHKSIQKIDGFPPYAINPISLAKWVTSSAIQLILAGGQFLEWMKRMQIMFIIQLIIQSICLILLFKISGIHFGKP